MNSSNSIAVSLAIDEMKDAASELRAITTQVELNEKKMKALEKEIRRKRRTLADVEKQLGKKSQQLEKRLIRGRGVEFSECFLSFDEAVGTNVNNIPIESIASPSPGKKKRYARIWDEEEAQLVVKKARMDSCDPEDVDVFGPFPMIA